MPCLVLVSRHRQGPTLAGAWVGRTSLSLAPSFLLPSMRSCPFSLSNKPSSHPYHKCGYCATGQVGNAEPQLPQAHWSPALGCHSFCPPASGSRTCRKALHPLFYFLSLWTLGMSQDWGPTGHGQVLLPFFFLFLFPF